jgi:hypothetical protein
MFAHPGSAGLVLLAVTGPLLPALLHAPRK